MIAFEAAIKEVVGNIWGIVVGSPMFGNTWEYTNILGFIRDDLQREYLCETPISPEERLVLGSCLYHLGPGDYYQTISGLTGHGIATVRNITQEVSNLIVSNLWKKIVVFPKSEKEFLNSINATENLWQYPTAFGGIDGCHIPLKCPHGSNEARKEYYNFNNFYSVVMMRIVGADYRFLWASAGLPGSVNDVVHFRHASCIKI